MLARNAPVSALILSFLMILYLPATSSPAQAEVALAGDGIVKVKSAHGFDETIELLKKDIADKGIMFFMAVDQAKLGEKAGIQLPPSTLLIFGNPPLDWPVRLLVTQDDRGQVWAVYTDFERVKRRHGIENRDDAFKMASSVIASITSSVAAK
jgi:uncharacterized protein (DUF302 family)